MKTRQVMARWLAGVLVAFGLAACSTSSAEEAAAFHMQTATGGTFPVAQFAAPVVADPGYMVIGHITVEAVEGSGYLEMWSVFPDGSRFFSRTLSTEGPMRAVTGSGSWDFELPFFLEGAPDLPNLLEVNLVLPGAGEVWVEGLQVSSLDSGATGGVVWGWAGAGLGMAGALIGGLASRLRARRFVLGALWVMAFGGVALLLIGVLRWTQSGFAPAYGFLLTGVIAAAVGGGSLPSIARRYRDQELRRVQALDLQT